MAILLALDTATENCSVALKVGDRIYQRDLESPREHSQRLLELVQDVLTEAELQVTDIQGIIAGIGPGSFTGVRIGVSVAQGLAYSLSVPVLGVSSLAALAQQAWRRFQISQTVCAIDARMNEVYLAAYQVVDGVVESRLAPVVGQPQPAWLAQQLADFAKWHAAGTGVLAYPASFEPHCEIQHAEAVRLPLAVDMLTIAAASWPANSQSAAELEPLYVRNEVTWQKLPGR